MYKLQRDYIRNPLRLGEFPIKEDLEYLYIECNLSTKEINEQYITNKSKYTIKKYLKYYNIKKPKKLIQEKYKQTMLERYGVENSFQSEVIKEKMKQTNIEKYGVEYTTQLKTVKDKAKQTCLEKYGVEYASQTNGFKEKVKQTNIKKYGVEHISRSELFKENLKNNNLEKYGVENIFQLEEIKEISKNKCLTTFGREYAHQKHISAESLIILHNKDELIKLFEDNNTKSRQIIADLLGVSRGLIDRKLKQYDISDNFKTLNSSSYYEEEIVNKIREFYQSEIITNSRILNRKEIDIYIPEHNLGIEFNGTHWHSEQILGKKGHNPITYHYDKSMLAKDKGIFLLHIFEFEYIGSKDKYIGYIKQLMGLVNKIPSKDCIIKQVDITEYKNFIEENSLQEDDNSDIRLGLYYDNELVEVIGLNNLGNNEYELINHSTKLDISLDDITPLLNNFINTYNPNKITGYNIIHNQLPNIFETANFKYQHTLEPNYTYIGSDKIYDCGKKVYVWDKY